MPDEITIRLMGPDDLRQLLSVEEGLFDNPVREKQAAAFLNSAGHIMFLAFDGAKAVGMASGTVLLHPDKAPSMFINEIGVRETHQRRGIGKALLREIIQNARDRACEGIWLGTEMDNAPARALYRSLGGKEVEGVYYGWDDAL